MKEYRYEGSGGLIVDGSTTMPDVQTACVRDMTEYVGLLLEKAGVADRSCTAVVLQKERGSPQCKHAAVRGVMGSQIKLRLQPHDNSTCRDVRLGFVPTPSLPEVKRMETLLLRYPLTLTDLRKWKHDQRKEAETVKQVDEKMKQAILALLQPDSKGFCLASDDPCGFASPEAIFKNLGLTDLPQEFYQGLSPAKVLAQCDTLAKNAELERSTGASPYFRIPEERLGENFAWAQRVGRQVYQVLTRCWPHLSYERMSRLHPSRIADHRVSEAQINSSLALACKEDCGVVERTGETGNFFYKRLYGRVCIYDNPARYENGEFHDLDEEFPEGAANVAANPLTSEEPTQPEADVAVPVPVQEQVEVATIQRPSETGTDILRAAIEVIDSGLRSLKEIESLATQASQKRSEALALNQKVEERMKESATAGHSQKLEMITLNSKDLLRLGELGGEAQRLEAQLVEQYLNVDPSARKQLNGTCPDRIAEVQRLIPGLRSKYSTDRTKMDEVMLLAHKYVIGNK